MLLVIQKSCSFQDFVIRGGYKPCESCDFTRSNCIHKIGKNRETYHKIGKNRNFHIVSIDTASASGNRKIKQTLKSFFYLKLSGRYQNILLKLKNIGL